jgi:transposase
VSVIELVRVAKKKKALHAWERDTPRVQHARGEYQQEIGTLAVKRGKFVDESGINLALTRRSGRAPRGERALGSVPQNYGANVTLIGALSRRGLEAPMTVEGATDGEVFSAYVKRALGPTLKAGDRVVMDNLRAHKVSGIREAIEVRGAKLLYLPPYSPDLSPIECCWSKLKTALRARGARTRRTLEYALKQALTTIPKADAVAWFTHCGYTVN